MIGRCDDISMNIRTIRLMNSARWENSRLIHASCIFYYQWIEHMEFVDHPISLIIIQKYPIKSFVSTNKWQFFNNHPNTHTHTCAVHHNSRLYCIYVCFINAHIDTYRENEKSHTQHINITHQLLNTPNAIFHHTHIYTIINNTTRFIHQRVR